jgi:hypothetical protein
MPQHWQAIQCGMFSLGKIGGIVWAALAVARFGHRVVT